MLTQTNQQFRRLGQIKLKLSYGNYFAYMKDQLHNTIAKQKVYVIKFKSHFIKKGIKFRCFTLPNGNMQKKAMFSYNQLSGIIVHKIFFIVFDILQIG